MRRLDEATSAALGGEMRQLDAVGTTCCLLVHACERARDYERASQWAERIERFTVEWGIAPALTVCRTQHAAMRIGRGEWAKAEEELVAAVERLTVSRPLLVVEGLEQLGELRRRQGRWEEAEELFARAEGRSAAPARPRRDRAGAGRRRRGRRPPRALPAADAARQLVRPRAPRSSCSSGPSCRPAAARRPGRPSSGCSPCASGRTPRRCAPPQSSPAASWPRPTASGAGAAAARGRGRGLRGDARAVRGLARPPRPRALPSRHEPARDRRPGRARGPGVPRAARGGPRGLPGAEARRRDHGALHQAWHGRRRRPFARPISPPARSRCCASSHRASATRRSPCASTSAATPFTATSRTSARSSPSPRAPPRSLGGAERAPAGLRRPPAGRRGGIVQPVERMADRGHALARENGRFVRSRHLPVRRSCLHRATARGGGEMATSAERIEGTSGSAAEAELAERTQAFAGRMLRTLNEGFLTLSVASGTGRGCSTRWPSAAATAAEDRRGRGLNERYVSEWLKAVVLGGIVEYDAGSGTYRLPAEHAAMLTRAAGPDNLAGHHPVPARAGGRGGRHRGVLPAGRRPSLLGLPALPRGHGGGVGRRPRHDAPAARRCRAFPSVKARLEQGATSPTSAAAEATR